MPSTRWSETRAAAARSCGGGGGRDRRLGPTASIETSPPVLELSKPALYRYLSDKADLLGAAVAYGAELGARAPGPGAVRGGHAARARRPGCDGHLATIEEHAGVFLLLAQQRVETKAAATRC